MRGPLRWLARTKHLPLSDGDWSYSRPVSEDDPEQGWKLHVSATILSAAEIFAQAEPILRRNNALFKVPCRLELLRSLNSGLADFSQSGKFLTVYPRSTDEAVKLARELHRATRGLAGPRIPFDAQYRKGSLVHYRYGAFRRPAGGPSGFIRATGGRRYRDKRAPGRAVPHWLEDPFQKPPAQKSEIGWADQPPTSRHQGESSARERGRLRGSRSFRSARAPGDSQRRATAWRNKLGRERRLCARSARGHRSCANCARQVCPSPRFFGSSPKTVTATWSSRKSRDALCSPQNECIRQDLPGAGPRKSLINWSRSFPECTPPAGPGAIASRRTFLFIAEQCDSSISREHVESIKPGCRRGVRRITPRRRLVENSPDGPEPSKMTTRSASSLSNSCPENSRPPKLIAGSQFTGAPVVRIRCARRSNDCSGRRFHGSV